MSPRPPIARLLIVLALTLAAAVAEGQAPLADLGPQARSALREAAAAADLQPWQREFMLRLTGRGGRTFGADSAGENGIPVAPMNPEGFWTFFPPDPLAGAPPHRVTPTGVYDPVRRRMVVFGGGAESFLNDVWALKLDPSFGWIQLVPAPGPAPSPRRLHGAVYDPVRDRMIVFGGGDDAGFQNDTWALQFTGPTGASWAQLTPLGTPPAPRADFAMIYDPPGDRILLFGGFDGVSPPSQRRSDLWQLTLAGTPQWTQLAPGAGPSARSGHRAAFDPVRRRMIVFGGYDVTFLADTWALSLSGPPAWTPIVPPGALPGPRVEHAVVYEPAGDRLLIYGGYDDPLNDSILSDTWALPLGSPAPWAPLNPGGPPLWGSAVILDPIRREMVVFGGSDGGASAYTFVLDLVANQWFLHPRIVYGPGVVTPSAVHDPGRNRMVVFGGARADYSNEVWVLTLGALPEWFQLSPTGTPPVPRRLHGAVFDAAGDRMIVFAGFNGAALNDTWALQFSGALGAAWTQIVPVGPAPPGRSDFALVLDPVARRLVAFGGYDGVSLPTGRRRDLWTLPLLGPPVWTQLVPPGAPTARSGHRAIYDPVRHRMVLFGGFDVAMVNDTWALTLGATPAWSQIATGALRPVPRADHGLAYDSQRDRLLLHGGYDGYYSFGDTWILPLATPAWSDISPLIGGPGPRWGLAAIYDRPYDRLVVFGGSSYDGRAHALNFDTPTPTLLALQSVEARPGLVRLVWHGTAPEGTPATVYRREAGADWRGLGGIQCDHAGRLTWEDRDVVGGARYDYRLGMLENGREEFTGATSVSVPTGIEMEVRGIAASAGGTLALWCAVPSAGQARLEILDLAGRRVAVRDLDWSSAGAMRVDVAPAPPTGLYFARLLQGGHAVYARVSVIH